LDCSFTTTSRRTMRPIPWRRLNKTGDERNENKAEPKVFILSQFNYLWRLLQLHTTNPIHKSNLQ
jgi:hypothetical protein